MGFGNIIVSLIFLILALWSFLFSRLAYGDYFAPAGIFFGVNLISLSFYQLKLLPFIPVKLQTYILIILSFLSFLVGALLASPSIISRKKYPRKTHNLLQKEDAQGLAIFYYITAFISFMGWLYYVIIILPPGWWHRLWILQFQVVPNHAGYLLLLNALVPPTFVLLTLLNRRVSSLSLLVCLFSLVALSLVGIKSYFVISLVTSFLVYAVVRPGYIKLKHLLFLSVLSVGFMILYDKIIDIFFQQSITSHELPTISNYFVRPYLYIAGPWPAMSKVMMNPPKAAHWAQVTLEPLWKLFGPGGFGILTERVPHDLPFVNIGPTLFNVYSLIGEIYWDFGWVGSIAGCFFLGFISTRIYVSARKYKSWMLYLSSSLFSYGIFISFFMYYYRGDLIFLLLYVLIIGKFLRKLSINSSKITKGHLLTNKKEAKSWV